MGRGLRTQAVLPALENCERYLGLLCPFPWGSWVPV